MENQQTLRLRIFAATWLSYVGFYFCRKNFSVLMPLLTRDEGFTSAQLAGALSIYSLCYVAGQFTSGLLSDRLGARRIVTAGMLLSAAVTALMGYSHSLSVIILCQAVNGYAQACGWPGLLKMMAATFESHSRGVIMGWWTTNYVIGGFLATVFATWAATGPVMLALGWHRGAWWPALVLALLALVFFLFSGRTPVEAAKPASAFAGLGEVVRNRAINVIGLMYFTLKMARYIFLFWLPLYMTQRLGYGPGEAGYTSSVFELAGFTGAVLVGYISDHVAGGRRFPVGTVMMFLLAVGCLTFPMLSLAGHWGNIVSIGLIGMMVFGTDTLMSGTAVQDIVRPQVVGTAGGYTNALGSLGQVLSPIIASTISTRYGWDVVFYLLVVITATGGAILATQWNHGKKTEAATLIIASTVPATGNSSSALKRRS